MPGEREAMLGGNRSVGWHWSKGSRGIGGAGPEAACSGLTEPGEPGIYRGLTTPSTGVCQGWPSCWDLCGHWSEVEEKTNFLHMKLLLQ